MRFTKQKRHRKIIKFYTACFAFREPFKVLCDGTFIYHLVSNKLTPDTSLVNTLGSPVQIFTTSCVIEELKSLGPSHADTYHSARKDYRLARCEHEHKKSAFDCILETIGDKNSEHFFVGTQDIDLRKKCRQVPGVPVIFGLRNALFLEQLSSFQREFVKSDEEKRSRVTESEKKMLQKRVQKILNTEDAGDLSPAEEGISIENLPDQAMSKKKGTNKSLIVKDKVQFKRRRAKGPNPLSCKKKKNQGSSGPESRKDQKTGGDSEYKRSRKRKRSRNGTKPGSEGVSS